MVIITAITTTALTIAVLMMVLGFHLAELAITIFMFILQQQLTTNAKINISTVIIIMIFINYITTAATATITMVKMITIITIINELSSTTATTQNTC